MDLEQVFFAANLLHANIPGYLLERYATNYCARHNLQLRRNQPLQRPQRGNRTALRFSSETIDYLRGEHIIEMLQRLLHVRVPEAPPPHMLHIFEGVCLWLLTNMRTARAQRDPAAHAGYTVA